MNKCIYNNNNNNSNNNNEKKDKFLDVARELKKKNGT